MAQTKVLVGTPSRGYILPSWRRNMEQTFGPLEHKFVIGKDVATARIEIMEYALAEDFTHLMFVDDDVYLPQFALHRLLKTMQMLDADVVNAPVWVKGDTGRVNLFRFYATTDADGNKSLITQSVLEPELQLGGVDHMDMGGLACTLINVELLKRLEKPWLVLGYVGKERRGEHELEYGTNVGEDFAFFTRCTNVGARKFVDYGVMCSHYEQSEDKYYPTPMIREMVTGQDKPLHEMPEPRWFIIERNT